MRWMRRSGLIFLPRSSWTGLDMCHILFMVEIQMMTPPFSCTTVPIKGRILVSGAGALDSPSLGFWPSSGGRLALGEAGLAGAGDAGDCAVGSCGCAGAVCAKDIDASAIVRTIAADTPIHTFIARSSLCDEAYARTLGAVGAAGRFRFFGEALTDPVAIVLGLAGDVSTSLFAAGRRKKHPHAYADTNSDQQCCRCADPTVIFSGKHIASPADAVGSSVVSIACSRAHLMDRIR